MKKYILSIDQGTTGTTVNIVDSQGESVASHDQDFAQIYPRSGWVEHDLTAIWSTVEVCTREALKKAALTEVDIKAIGITNQRETVAIWNRTTHAPIYNAIVWQCRRTTDFCEKLKKKSDIEKTLKTKTGLVIDPYFSASKVRWLLENVKDAKAQAQKGELAAGTIDTFLMWKLSNGSIHATDVSNASRTQLMNIHKGEWDESLLKIFSVPANLLPTIMPSSGVFGHTKGLSFLPDGIPIAGVAGDQQAALFGQACFKEGEAKCTFGTGSFILMNTGKKPVTSKAGMLTTIAWQLQGQPRVYAIEGGAFICGAAVQWLRDELGFFQSSSEVESLAAMVPDSDGVEFVPALTGLGAPHWNAEARGLICGLTRGSNRAHIARATLEAMALQNAEILQAMQKDLGKNILHLKVDGGASANQLLMQIQADYLGCTITRPKNIETTSMGAAFLAGLGVGIWSTVDEIRSIWKTDADFEPKMPKRDRMARFARWNTAVARATLKSK